MARSGPQGPREKVRLSTVACLLRRERDPIFARGTIPGVRHFQIAWALARFYARVIPADWYRHVPFLPLPPADYLRWRLHTAYGKQRPPLRTIVRDVWQFGDWLRTFPG